MKPRVQQLHPSGATDGQVITYDAGLGYPVFADPTPVAVCRATFVASGGETVLFLGVTPIASSEQVFVNGLLKTFGVDYTLTGSTVVLTSALSAADRLVVSYFTAALCGIASLSPTTPVGFTRPVALSRPVRRFHRIR